MTEMYGLTFKSNSKEFSKNFEKMGIKMLSPPSWVMMMDDGGVVTMGGSPFIVYYPNWGIMSHFTGAQISEYSAKLPGIIEVWDVGSTALGPMV